MLRPEAVRSLRMGARLTVCNQAMNAAARYRVWTRENDRAQSLWRSRQPLAQLPRTLDLIECL